ncbi:MAG TPA: NmrA family NAD(P)-binding protein [Candidatus Saccharimonadales bacterium]|nr:NmrA family NAD(P)-binding protein [Candidatus Saccharimonadales bacterium]
MRITVTTPTGHVGGAVARTLLDGGAEVVLPVRNPEKVRTLAARGAKVVQGSMEDGSFMARACVGADALFFVTPSNYKEEDLRASQNRVGRAGAEAIRASGVPRVVNLSSLGAQHTSGIGPVLGLREVEGHLNDTSAEVLHLRPAFFMENFLLSLASIRESGSLFMPLEGATRLAMIATKDVAREAAARLLDPKWRGHPVVELLGPADPSLDEAAGAISEGLGRSVKFVTIPEDAAREALRGLGASRNAADAMMELYQAIEGGRLVPEDPSRTRRTSTTLIAFAREVMKPLMA